MAANMRSVEFQPGEVVLLEGEPGNLFYVVEEGEAEAIGKGGTVGADVCWPAPPCGVGMPDLRFTVFESCLAVALGA